MRTDAQELAQLKAANATDEAGTAATSWQGRVKLLKQYLEQNPITRIVELQLATEQDWLAAAREKLETERDYRLAMGRLRRAAEEKWAALLKEALTKYLDAHQQQFPTTLSQLQPHFAAPVDEALLERYAILPSETLPGLAMGGKWLITQTYPLDGEYDSRAGITERGWSMTGPRCWNDSVAVERALQEVMQAHAAAHAGQGPGDVSEILPYASTPEQQRAVYRMIRNTRASQQARRP